MSTFPDIGLGTAIDVVGTVPLSHQLWNFRLGRTAVIGGKDNERVFFDAFVFQRLQDAPDPGVGLHHEIAIIIQAALSFPFRYRKNGRVWTR